MTGEAVLIAAFSGRALAQSARRAGYVPLVADAFADMDMMAAAKHSVHLPNAVRQGFTAKTLVPALDDLIARSGAKPIGIVLGSGFEDRPKLIETLDKRYRVLGTRAETVAELKEPQRFFPLLKQLGLAHPETRLERPEAPGGWVVKRAGAAGGAHIRDLTPNMRAERHYFQRRIEGTPMSVLAIATKDGITLELSRQWMAPSPRKPYRYGGAAITEYAETKAQQQMISAAATLIELLDPVGLLSFDFLVDDDRAHLLEVNPRPGATLDIFDDLKGNLFRAHVEAGLGNALWQKRELPPVQSRASALLYADDGPLTVGEIDWPEWASDRPAPGTRIPAGTPIATVHADGPNDTEAERLARARLSDLARLFYTQSKKS